MKTDDRFFLLRGSAEPDQSGSSTSVVQTLNSYDVSGGFRVATAATVSATFSSAEIQERERNYILLIGVILGAVTSIGVNLLSGLFDVLAKRRST
ncbi:hypothetical protein AYX22_01640 [Arthrobacter sp. D5-1]|nr:hypothetical protein AYX22_01640 [Arthrobacter sp. D5-1]